MSIFDHHDERGMPVACGDAEAELKRLRAFIQELRANRDRDQDTLIAEQNRLRAELAQHDPAKVAGWIAERDELAGQVATVEQENDRLRHELAKAGEAYGRLTSLARQVGEEFLEAHVESHTFDGHDCLSLECVRPRCVTRNALLDALDTALAASDVPTPATAENDVVPSPTPTRHLNDRGGDRDA